jgi:hypothetical protein
MIKYHIRFHRDTECYPNHFGQVGAAGVLVNYRSYSFLCLPVNMGL